MPKPCRSAFVCGVLVLLLALGGCTPEPEPKPSPDSLSVAPPDSVVAPAPDPFPAFARRATAIEIALDDYRRAEGTWQAGGAASTFTAYLDGESVRMIEEERRDEAFGLVTTVTYFEDGLPFYVVEDADLMRTRVAFGPDGTVVATERLEDGERGEISPAEAGALWAHALALAAQIPPPAPL